MPKLAIIGAGLMGSGIAVSGALAGNDVVLYDADSAITARGVASATYSATARHFQRSAGPLREATYSIRFSPA